MSKDNIFKEIVDIIDWAVSDWWLDAGTCLAVVRKGDFIASTDDVDIGIPGHQAEFKACLIREFTQSGFNLSKERVFDDKLMTLGFTGPEKLDLFFYYEKDGCLWHTICGWEDERQQRKVFKPEKFSKHLFDDLKKVRFKDRDVYLPNPPETYLTERYGLDWAVPNPHYRFWRDSQAIDMEFLND